MKTRLTIILVIASFLCTEAQEWTWSEDYLSIAREGLSATALDDSIFFSQGRLYSTAFVPTIDIYDVSEDQWTSYESLSNPRWNTVSVSCNGKVFIAGGNNWGSGTLNFADVDVYSTETGAWSIDYLSVARSLIGATCHMNKVFFAGGMFWGYNVVFYDVIDVYDTETDTWSTLSLNEPKAAIGVTAAGGKVFFAGGAPALGIGTDVVEIYDISSDSWTYTSLSQARSFPAAVAYDNKVYFAGGALPNAFSSDVVDIYNVDTESWEPPQFLSFPRIVRAFQIRDALVFAGETDYITGGGIWGAANGIIDVYYPETGVWDFLVPDLNPARIMYGCAAYDDKAYFGGGYPGGTTVSDVVSILEYPKGGIIHVPGDHPRIQLAIDAATIGDTILVDEGIYYENINFKGKAITIASQFLMDADTSHISSTIIDGSQPASPDSASVVYFNSGEDTTSIICGFTIQNGTGTYPDAFGFRSGGGIFVENAGAKIIHNIIRYNNVSYTNGASGGGIFADTCFNRLLVVKHNTISWNTSMNGNSQTVAYGGGAFISMPVFMQHNIFTNNTASGKAYGAGLATWHCTGTIKQNLFMDNHADVTIHIGWGGGVYCESPKPGLEVIQNTIIGNSCFGTGSNDKAGGLGVLDFDQLGNYYIDRNIIQDNITRLGAGISIYGPKFAHITNNVVQNNEAMGSGGGIYLMHASNESLKNYAGRGSLNSTCIQNNKKESGLHQIINNTVTQNTAGALGGGIASFLIDYDFLAFNNIIYDNSALQGDDIYLLNNTCTAHLYNNNVDTDLIGGEGIWTGDNNIFVDPEFEEDGYHLSQESECIEAGILFVEMGEETYYCPAFDIDGQMRPLNATADIGADEVLMVGTSENITSDNSNALQIFPNPGSGTSNIRFIIHKQGYTTLELFNISGEMIKSLVNEMKTPGTYEMEFDLSDIPAGVYFCVLKTNEGIQTKKIIKL